MPLTPQDYRKTAFTHRRGLAASKPAASDVLVGTLYFSTDTTTLERSDGSVWSIYSGGGGPPGPTGPQGIQGISGLDGQDGSDGLDGISIKGDTGPIGATGSAGRDGLSGLPGIDAEEEYPYIIPGPIGNTGPSGPSGGSATTIEVNLSTTATWRGKFTITNGMITGASKILAWQAPGPYTGKGNRADEAELQPVKITVVESGTGSATAYWETPPYLTDKKLPMMVQNTTVINTEPKDPQAIVYGVPTRLGKVRGNVKFSYMVL